MKLIKNFKRKYFDDQFLKVYSHPRSGTHFLEAFLAKNFYQGKDLSIEKVSWGHWSDRRVNENGNPYGIIFGNHHFPKKTKNNNSKIYIVRDGRAVAYSIWKTPNFINKNISGINFQDFLKIKIDWKGTPASKSAQEYTILEHWYKHVKAWEDSLDDDKKLLIIKYEDLINNPYEEYLKIHNKFFKNKKILSVDDIDIIKKPVGLLPNKATIDSWEKVFTEEDNLFYFKILSKGLNSYKI